MPHANNIFTAQKTYVIIIAALLLVLPLLYGFSTGIMIVLLAVSIVSLRYHKLVFPKAVVLPMLFYGLMMLSLLWTDDTGASSRGLERQLALIMIPFSFMLMPSLTEKTRNTILFWFSAGMALFALLFIGLATLKFTQDGNTSVFFYHELVAPLDLNAIYISVFVSICLLFLLFKQKKTPISIAVLAILAVFLLLMSSKSIMVATGLLGLFGIFRTFKRTTVLKLTALLGIGIVLLLVTSNPVRDRFQRELTVSNVKEVMESDRFNKVYDWTGTTLRLFQARIFSEMIQEDNAVLLGYGINNSQKRIVEKQKEYNLWQGYYTYNFHNQYIQSFAELGLFGLLFLFLLLGALLRQYILGKDMLFLSLFFIMFVVFFTESYLWRQRGLYHFLVLYCLLFKALPQKNEPITNETN